MPFLTPSPSLACSHAVHAAGRLGGDDADGGEREDDGGRPALAARGQAALLLQVRPLARSLHRVHRQLSVCMSQAAAGLQVAALAGAQNPAAPALLAPTSAPRTHSTPLSNAATPSFHLAGWMPPRPGPFLGPTPTPAPTLTPRSSWCWAPPGGCPMARLRRCTRCTATPGSRSNRPWAMLGGRSGVGRVARSGRHPRKI